MTKQEATKLVNDLILYYSFQKGSKNLSVQRKYGAIKSKVIKLLEQVEVNTDV